jgi:hypothetical protein
MSVENTDKTVEQFESSGVVPDAQGRTCGTCGSVLVRDMAGLACDYCWRVAGDEFEDEEVSNGEH